MVMVEQLIAELRVTTPLYKFADLVFPVCCISERFFALWCGGITEVYLRSTGLLSRMQQTWNKIMVIHFAWGRNLEFLGVFFVEMRNEFLF